MATANPIPLIPTSIGSCKIDMVMIFEQPLLIPSGLQLLTTCILFIQWKLNLHAFMFRDLDHHAVYKL